MAIWQNIQCEKVTNVNESFPKIPIESRRYESLTFHLMGDMTFRGETAIGIDIFISRMASIEPVIIPNMVMTVEFDLWLHFTWTKNYLFPQTKMLFLHSTELRSIWWSNLCSKTYNNTIFFVVRCERDFLLMEYYLMIVVRFH